MKENIMLDLETMGNSPTSAIISIGAVAFDKHGIGEGFYVNVDLQSCLDLGLTVDGSTVYWWLNGSDDARKAISDDLYNIHDALNAFASWVERNAKNPRVWGNGAAFDNAILSHAYRSLKINQPWRFWNDMCYRTVKNLHPEIELVREGVHHNALDDAKSQANHLIKIMNKSGE